MRVWTLRYFASLLAAGLLAFAAHAERATFAVASNFKPAMEALEADFESRTGHDITSVYGATGKLYSQIRLGAPFDGFLAADQERPQRLIEEGRAVEDSHLTYAIGRLVLWRPKAETVDADSLSGEDYRFLALANPDLAPYGAAAIDTLRRLGLEAQTENRRALGENIGQAFAFVRTGNAELGFIAGSQLAALPEAERGVFWDVPQDYHTPILQDGVLLARGADNEAARAFLDYLKSNEARALIERSGYALP